MDTSTPLFRQAVLDHQRTRTTGNLLLVLPPSLHVMAAFAACLGALLALFVAVGTYTRKERVNGVLLPQAGLTRMVATQPGVVVERLVHEGQFVRKGAVMFHLQGMNSAGGSADVQQDIGRELRLREDSLKAELDRQLALNRLETGATQQRLLSLERELDQLAQIETVARAQENLARQGLARQQALADVGYISKQQLQQPQDALLAQQLKIKETERLRTSQQRERDSLQSTLMELQLKGRNLNAQLDRALSSVKQEQLENQVRQGQQVRAPQDGLVAAVLAEPGQMLTAGSPLVQLVPADSALQAHLYAPSRAIGFIRAGAPVQLRYQAYPYQKFGQQAGVVSQISRVAVAPGDLPYPGTDGEALYRITVTLAAQRITAYGRDEPLHAGMRLDADIVLDRRRLYEWILEPLYSVSGKLAGDRVAAPAPNAL